MFFFGFLSSTAPYIIMLLAYLLLLFSGAQAPVTEQVDMAVVHQQGHAIVVENGCSDQSTHAIEYQMATAMVDQPTVDPVINDVDGLHFGNISHLIVENEFCRFFFSLPPPLFC